MSDVHNWPKLDPIIIREFSTCRVQDLADRLNVDLKTVYSRAKKLGLQRPKPDKRSSGEAADAKQAESPHAFVKRAIENRSELESLWHTRPDTSQQ